MYISAAQQSSRQNSEDHFPTDGMSIEIFRLTMSQKRFKFLMAHL